MQSQPHGFPSKLFAFVWVAVLSHAGSSPAQARNEGGGEPAAKPPVSVADSWDRVFRDKPYRPARPEDSFAARCVDRMLRQGLLERGDEALVLAMGDGANAVYLAQRGLDVTGMDISPVALETARKAARAAGVSIRAEQADLFDYDLGRERWDLVTNVFYNPAIRILERIKASVRPGGLLLIEGYGAEYTGPGPVEWSRYRENQLIEALDGWRILEYQDGLFPTVWAANKPVPVVRVLARKPALPSAPETPR